MYVIIPTEQLGLMLQNSINKRILNTKQTKKSIKLFYCVEVMIAISEEMVLNNLMWTSKCSYIQDNISRLVDHLPIEKKNERLLNYYIYSVLIDEQYEYLLDFINKNIPINSEEDLWRIWYTKRIGNDFVFEKGPDSRVLDWEERINTGEIQPPSFYLSPKVEMGRNINRNNRKIYNDMNFDEYSSMFLNNIQN